jgi:hypothetical protein
LDADFNDHVGEQGAGSGEQGEVSPLALRPVQNAVNLCMNLFSPQSAIGNPQFPRAIKQSRFALVFILFAALILSAKLAAEEVRQNDAVTVFHCAFGDDWDVNYDAWPDRWVRQTGLGFPQYVNIAIHNDTTAIGHKSLQIDLDGASAAVVSPPIRVMSRFSYVFEAQVKNVGLKYSTVTIALDFCDSNGRVLQTEQTEPLSTTNGWQSIQLGPVELGDPAIDRVTIGLQALHSHKGDLHGHVSLANVCLKRLPRIDVATNSACNVYTSLSGVEIKCALSGIREQAPKIDFQLLDGANKELQREHFRLNGQPIVDDPRRGTEATEAGAGPAGYEGTITWQPKIPDYGFYRVAVLMLLLEIGQKLDVLDAAHQAIPDPRNPAAITHQQRELLAQRVFALAAGYEDGNIRARSSSGRSRRGGRFHVRGI